MTQVSLNRRQVSTLAKLDFAGLKHAQRIDAIARALGYKTGEALMGALKAAEGAPESQKQPSPIREIHLWGREATDAFEEATPFDGGWVSESLFSTPAEYKAYLQGVEDASGWMDDLHVIDTISNPDHPYFRLPETCKSVTFQDWWNSPLLHVVVEGSPSEPEDEDVAGIYSFSFDPSSEQLTRSSLAGSALDAFHETVAIHNLDDFEIEVIDAWGNPYLQEDEYNNYSCVHDMDRVATLNTTRAELMESIAQAKSE